MTVMSWLAEQSNILRPLVLSEIEIPVAMNLCWWSVVKEWPPASEQKGENLDVQIVFCVRILGQMPLRVFSCCMASPLTSGLSVHCRVVS